MTTKKVYVKPHERRGETGKTEHVRGHTRNQEVKGKTLSNQEIPEDTFEGVASKEGPKK